LHLSQTNFGASSAEVGRSLWMLGRLRFQLGELAEAKTFFEQSLAMLETTHAPATDASAVLDDLAKVYARDQQWPLAKHAYERALAIDRKVLGEDSPRVAAHLNDLAIVAQNMGNELQHEGRLTEAEPVLRDAVAETLALYGADHYTVGYTRVSLGLLLEDEGRLAEAELEYREALAIYDKSLPANHQWRAAALMQLARLLVDRGQAEEALDLSEQSLAIWTTTSPASSPWTAQAHSVHAYALAHLGRSREAQLELAAALPLLLSARGADDPAVRRARRWLDELAAQPPHTASALPE
jgi:tetratricopeptide (TPR) repeat protein